jgi:hypothetical protein
MTITADAIQFCVDTLTAETAARYAAEHNMDTTEALRQFMKTKTFDLLLNADSYLYLESAEYVFDMLQAEQSGNWERWLEI